MALFFAINDWARFSWQSETTASNILQSTEQAKFAYFIRTEAQKVIGVRRGIDTETLRMTGY